MNSITCPYCWQAIDVDEPEPSACRVEFVIDCEVCCRPIAIKATWSDQDSSPQLEAEPEAD